MRHLSSQLEFAPKFVLDYVRNHALQTAETQAQKTQIRTWDPYHNNCKETSQFIVLYQFLSRFLG